MQSRATDHNSRILLNETTLRALHGRRPQIRERWEALLRLERVRTPLAHPDTLVFMFDQTLDEVLSVLPGRSAGTVRPRPECRCECNPMRVYFPTLEQALLEALILAQSEQPALGSEEKVAAVAELCSTLRRIAKREIAVFDKICQRRKRTR